jgi:hypothetical protein
MGSHGRDLNVRFTDVASVVSRMPPRKLRMHKGIGLLGVLLMFPTGIRGVAEASAGWPAWPGAVDTVTYPPENCRTGA